MNLSYARMGGHPPESDELLKISAIGEFTLRRVVALDRVGEFAGTLPAEGVADVRRRMEAATGETSPEARPQRPQQVHETLRAGNQEWDVYPEWEDGGPLGQLVALARALSRDLTGEPVTALAFSLSDDAGHGRLEALGDGGLSMDFTEASAEYSLFGEDQGFLASGELPLALPSGPHVPPPRWTAEVSLPTTLDFNPERTLQVRFTFRMKFDDGIWRDAQITSVSGKGWF